MSYKAIVFSLIFIGMVITSMLGIIYLKQIGIDKTDILLAGGFSIIVILMYMQYMWRELQKDNDETD